MKNKIKSVHLFEALSPISRPIADSTHSIDKIGFLITRIELESGVFGESNLLAFHYSPAAIAGALRDISQLTLGFEVNETGRFIREALAETEYFGNVGLNRWAVGAVNIAMWDAWGKVLGQPVWKVLGVHHSGVPVYGSGGWLSYSIPELLAEVTGYVKRGFRAVKIKVGSPELSADIERLTKVREAVGLNVNVMMDANQGMTVPSALELSRRVRHLNIHWFEEPVPRTDFDGYEHLRRQAGMALAMGEREFDCTALRELIRRNALDLWQPDIMRLGGVESWRESAFIANGHGLPVLPHYYKEYDVPLLCTVPRPFGSESFDWIDGLVDNPIPISNGRAHPLPGPGWGFTFRQDKLTPIS